MSEGRRKLAGEHSFEECEYDPAASPLLRYAPSSSVKLRLPEEPWNYGGGPVLPHERLDKALNRRRLDLRMDWNDVARAIGISPESLRAIRKGRNGPKEITARAIDEWLGWEPGSTEAVFGGGEPTPRTGERPPAAGEVDYVSRAVELRVLVNAHEPEPEFPPGGLRNQAERIIWAMVDEPWQVRLAQILAGREVEASMSESTRRAKAAGSGE